MVEPVTGTIAGGTSTKILSNVVDDLYTFLKEKATVTINKRNVQRKLPTLVSRMQTVRLVKTLWQVDTAVDVESFYCDSHVVPPATKNRNKRRKKIDAVSDFGPRRNIAVRGIAGQGKSIFIRHLCIKEFEAGQRIPVFIELRRIQKNETLLNHISRFLDILDLPIDDKLFRILLQSGKFIFFLDGFDEVLEGDKPRILNELENLAASSEHAQFLVTSRPNTAIEMSPFFDVFTLDDLRGKEYQAVIRKLTESWDYANILIRTITAHKANVAELLCNPLLVTLLLISYKSFQKLPERLCDFYESIFYVLLRRHDGTKPGFIRPRRCAINDNQYREVFDTFCFESKKAADSHFDYQQVCKLVDKSIKRANLNEDADNYLRDIKEVTCLILEEGGEYRFIHKSVQEYYAACFVRNRPEHSIRRFYGACLADLFTAGKWQQELGYLAEIDQYRYNRHYLIPLCHKFLNVDNDDELLRGRPEVTLELTRHVIGSYLLRFDLGTPRQLHGLNIDTLSQILDEIGYVGGFFRLDYGEFVTQLGNGNISVNEELLKQNYFVSKSRVFPAPKDSQKVEVVVEQIIEEGYLVGEFNAIAARIVERVYNIWKQAYSYVDREDSFDITAEIDI